MNKFRNVAIFTVLFIVVAVVDMIIFIGLFSQVFVNQFSWILDNTILSVLIFFWLFIGTPSLVAYFIAFQLLKGNKTGINIVDEKKVENNQLKIVIITIIVLGLLITAFIRWGTQARFLPYTFHNIQSGELTEVFPPSSSYPSPSLIPEKGVLPSSTTEIQPNSSVAPVSKFALHLHAIDYSIGKDNGSLPGTMITLFDKSGNKMGQGIQGVDGPQEGPIGNPAYVDFSVPLGEYSYTAEKDTLIRKGSITINSFDDAAYKQIYVFAKPITIKGRFFVDENKNRQYDPGEKTFENQEIKVFYQSRTPDKIWGAGSTKTGSNGVFQIVLEEKWEGEYILGASQVLGYQELPQPHFQAKGGQVINQDIYLWPL